MPSREAIARRLGKVKSLFISTIKILAVIVGFLFAIFVVFSFADMVIDVFPETIDESAITDILRAIVELDGILLGFSGIIFAQLFASVMSQQNVLYESLLENPEKRVERGYMLDFFDDKRANLAILACFVFFLLMCSIIGSLKFMADVSTTSPTETTSIFTRDFLFLPLLFMLGAVATLFLSFNFFSLKPPLKE